MATRYTADTSLVSIAVKGTAVRYGFRTTDDDAINAILGHAVALDATGLPVNGVIFGANSPKPPRASKKRISGETDTSFVGSDAIAGARAAGWKIIPGSIAVPRTTKLSVPVYVPVRTGVGDAGIAYNYAWRMPRYQHNIIGGELEILGIGLVTQDNFDEMWFGVNRPKPKRASRDLDGNSTITTFIATAREDNVGTPPGATEGETGWYLSGSKKSRVQFGV